MSAVSESIAALPPLQRRMAEAWLSRFEENWHDQKLREYMRALPVQSSLRRPLLLAMIERDLTHHWDQGRKVGVEEYLTEFLELGTIDDLPIELIAAEFSLRQKHGAAEFADFAERFPSRIDDLYVLLKPALFESGPVPGASQADDAATERRLKLLRTPADVELTDPVAEKRLKLLRFSPEVSPELPAAPEPPHPATNMLPTEGPKSQTPDAEMFLPPEPPQTEPTKKIGVSPAQTVWLDIETVRDPSKTAATKAASRTVSQMPPSVLGRYRIERRLGCSGLGSVYEAIDTQLERRVVLRIPIFAGKDAELDRARFHREARTAAGLSHPLLCPVLDVGQAEGFDFLVVPYVEGDALQELMQQRPIWPVRQAVDLVLKLATALDAAHRHGVIHRNLKPPNILIAPSETPVVVGFGQWLPAAHTRQGPNAAYLAPELIDGPPDVTGPRIDVFSLGVIFYQILTGTLPVGPVRSSTKLTFPGDLDVSLQEICRKAMAADADDRYSNMREFIQQLTAYRQTLRPSSSGSWPMMSGVINRRPSELTPTSVPGLPGSIHTLPAGASPPAPVATQESAASPQIQQLQTPSSHGLAAVQAPSQSARPQAFRWQWLIAAGVGAIALIATLFALSGGFGGSKSPTDESPPSTNNKPGVSNSSSKTQK